MGTTVTGIVINGNKIGRRIGFPTANIAVGPQGPDRNGVYTARVTAAGKTFRAVVNVGYKPTIAGPRERTLEAYLFDCDGDLYGQEIRVELLEFLRPERKFGSLDELRAQIEADKRQAAERFGTAERPFTTASNESLK